MLVSAIRFQQSGRGDVTEISENRNTALRDYGVLDRRVLRGLDEIAFLAAQVCNANFATISFLDREIEKIVSTHGFDEPPASVIANDSSFCKYVVHSKNPLLIEDARLDSRFSESPLVTEYPKIRFYYGAALATPTGIAIGTLAVMDGVTRSLSTEQQRIVQALADRIIERLEIERQSPRNDQPASKTENEDLRAMFESFPGLAWAVEPSGFRLVAITREVLDVLKKSRDEIIGRTVSEVFPADPHDSQGSEGQEVLLASLRKVVETGERDVLPVHRYALPSTVAGDNRFVERYWSIVNAPVFGASGQLKYVLHVTQDVTGIIDAGSGKMIADSGVERLKADVVERTKELKRVNEHLQLAQRIAKIGSWELRLPEFRRHWSSEIYRILGTTPESVDEIRSMQAFIHPDDRKRVLKAREEALEGHVSEIEHRIVRPDGETRVVVQRGRLIADSEGRPQLLYGTMQDVTESRKAEAEIKELETRLVATLENITDAFFTLDREWRFTYINRRAEELLHRNRNELLGNIVWDEFDSAVNSAFYTEYHRAVEKRETVKFEEYYAPINAWLGVTAYPSHNGLAVYFRDVTEQKRNEAALRESEERFRVVAKATADTIWDWNLDTGTMWWNEGLYNVFGYRPEQVEPDSRSFLSRIHPDDKQRVVDLIQSVLENGADEWKAEYRFRRDNGSYADVIVRGYIVRDVNGKPVRMVGGMNDVTEAKEKENRLTRQAALLDKAHDAIIVHDMHYRIRFWNRSAQRIYGWTPEEAIGQPIDRLLYTNQDVFDEAVRTLIATGEWSGEVAKRHKDGRTVVSDVSWSLLVNDNGVPEAIMSIDTDITERLLLEEQLRQSQRLESVGQLTGGVAHDFNNLLTVILGNAELLVDQVPPDGQAHRLAEMTRMAALRGAELTHRLLAFARRQALEPRVVDINELVDNLNNMLRRTLLENIDIEIIEQPDTWKAYVDPGQLESVLLNLCINAKDAMSGGGKLTIETANVELDEVYAANNSEVAPGCYAMIAVSDIGGGIAPECLDRVFDPFFTTKEKGKGTGLGLSMAYGFAKQSQGHIKIYSEPGHGTTVKLYLPRATRPDEKADFVIEKDHDLRGNEKILVVEDNDLVRSHAETQLGEYGYKVLTASNGHEAIEILKNNDDIQLLFTDVIMSGGMNGRELAEMAKRIRPRMKILYTSGYTENAIVHHGRLDQGVNLLQKPYQRRDLARKVRHVLKTPPADSQPET